jgi:hypothetical protein
MHALNMASRTETWEAQTAPDAPAAKYDAPPALWQTSRPYKGVVVGEVLPDVVGDELMLVVALVVSDEVALVVAEAVGEVVFVVI